MKDMDNRLWHLVLSRVSLQSGYTESCIRAACGDLMTSAHSKFQTLLNSRWLEHSEFTKAVVVALTSPNMLRAEHINIIATILFSSKSRQIFADWIKAVSTRGLVWGRTEDAILSDIGNAVTKSQNFTTWLHTLNGTYNSTQRTPYKIGGFYVTPFWIFLERSGALVYRENMPLIHNNLSDFTWGTFSAKNWTYFYYSFYNDRQVQRNWCVDPLGNMATFSDNDGNTYRIIKVSKRTNSPLVINAVRITNNQERPRHENFTLDWDESIIPLDNTLRVPSWQVPRSEPAGSSEPEEVSPRQG